MVLLDEMRTANLKKEAAFLTAFLILEEHYAEISGCANNGVWAECLYKAKQEVHGLHPEKVQRLVDKMHAEYSARIAAGLMREHKSQLNQNHDVSAIAKYQPKTVTKSSMMATRGGSL